MTPSTALSQRLGMSCLPASKACLLMRHTSKRFEDDASHAGVQPSSEEAEAGRAKSAVHLAQHAQPATRGGLS